MQTFFRRFGLLSVCSAGLVGCSSAGGAPPSEDTGDRFDGTLFDTPDTGDGAGEVSVDADLEAEVLDASLDGLETSTDTGFDTAFDAPMDADTGPPPPVTCTTSPKFQPALKLQHSPEGLRRVATAAMARLSDGRLLVVMLEALDTAGRHAIYARTVDPATGTAAPDVRLDDDVDALTASSPMSLTAVGDGAAAMLVYATTPTKGADAHLRVFTAGKWSPEPIRVPTEPGGPSFPIANNEPLSGYVLASGEVLVTKAGESPMAIAYRPFEGGIAGSFSLPQALGLAGGVGSARVDGYALGDGRFLALVWHGAGGPSVRIRAPSGAWTTPGPRADIGATSNLPVHRILDDGTIVLVAVEPATFDTRRIVGATYSVSTAAWAPSRLVSKVGPLNAVISGKNEPLLFQAGPSSVDVVAWLSAPCTKAAAECEFKPYQRRFEAGDWKDGKALDLSTVTGTTGTSVLTFADGRPYVLQQSADRKQVTAAIRPADGDFTAGVSLFVDPFDAATSGDVLLFRSMSTVWALASRSKVDGPLATLIGRLEIKAPPVPEWSVVKDDLAEWRNLTFANAYADGADGFTVAATMIETGTPVPFLAHANSGEAPTFTRILQSDESSLNYAYVPTAAVRPKRDKSAMYVVFAKSTDPTVTGQRLRAYAWNGLSKDPVFRPLADGDTRKPRTFPTGLALDGCGGSILYAVDKSDGTFGLELVVVK